MLTPIIVTAIVYFIIGFLIHGPLFGKLWMKLAGVTPTGNEKFSDMYGQMFWNIVVNLIICTFIYGAIWVASHSPIIMGDLTWYKGAMVGAWLWFGFVVPNTLLDVIWMKRKFSYWLFEAICSLICMGVAGAILAVWG